MISTAWNNSEQHAMHVPLMQDVLGTQPVTMRTWAVVAALAVSVVPAVELHKWLWSLRYRTAYSPGSSRAP